MISLTEYLSVKEIVVDRFSPINYNGIKYDCAITNARILLYKRNMEMSAEIDYEGIDSLSLEKSWYDIFFFAMFFSLILGSTLLVVMIPAYFPDFFGFGPNIINIMGELLYPGLGFEVFGIITLFYYTNRMNYFALLSGAETTYRLYSRPELLNEFSTLIREIKSGEINVSKIKKLKEIPIQERLLGRIIASFDNIGVKITFKDESNKKVTINTTAIIEFNVNSMLIVASIRYQIINQKKYKKIIGSNLIPLYTEESLYQIPEIAKELKIKRVFLLNISLDLKKISFKGYRYRRGLLPSKNLVLEIDTNLGKINLELMKTKLALWSPAKDLVEILNIIREYGK